MVLFSRRGKHDATRSEALRQALSRLDGYRHEIGQIHPSAQNMLGLDNHRRCRMVRGSVARECIAQSEEEIAKEHRMLTRE